MAARTLCCALWLGALTAAPAAAEAPRRMPGYLERRYTMNGQIPTGDFYVDDTGPKGEGSHYRYNAEVIGHYMKQAEKTIKMKTFNLQQLNKANWIFQALREHPFKEGAKGAVYGSMDPWYECIAIAHGASSVTTIEYNKLTYEHEKITTRTVAECDENPRLCRGFDFAFSISSFDHDGLGRYGDPLNPDGDIEAMKKTLTQLAPGGLLYLTIPVGPDVVVWNLHRRYGPIRLPLMLEGWEVVGRIGWDEAKLTREVDFRRSFEPVLVLRKPGAVVDHPEGEAKAEAPEPVAEPAAAPATITDNTNDDVVAEEDVVADDSEPASDEATAVVTTEVAEEEEGETEAVAQDQESAADDYADADVDAEADIDADEVDADEVDVDDDL